MAPAILWAAGVLISHSVREHRRLNAEKILKGEMPAAAGSVHVAVAAGPGLEHEAHRAVDDAMGSTVAGARSPGRRLPRLPRAGEILVGIPEENLRSGSDAPKRLADHLAQHDAADDAGTIGGDTP